MASGLAATASLLSDPTRVEILETLMDGRFFPATELAARAHVANSTASYHLSLLAEAGLVDVAPQGRCRYYGLASFEVAEVLEGIGVLAARSSPTFSTCPPALREARSCYNHLAGRLGVELSRKFEEQGWTKRQGNQFVLTDAGREALSSAELAVTAPEGKRCLDWSERKPHIGGLLGRALFQALLENGWIERGPIPRQICFTASGERNLSDRLYISIEETTGMPCAFS